MLLTEAALTDASLEVCRELAVASTCCRKESTVHFGNGFERLQSGVAKQVVIFTALANARERRRELCSRPRTNRHESRAQTSDKRWVSAESDKSFDTASSLEAYPPSEGRL